jgi:hypothetical protein
MGRYVFRVWPEGQSSYDVEGQGNGISDARKNVARREGVPANKVFHHTTVSTSKGKKSSESDSDGGGGIPFDWRILVGLFAIYLVIEYWWIFLIVGAIALGAYFIKD